MVFEFWLYDDDPSMPSTTGTARNFNEIRAYTGNGIPAYGGAGLQGLIAMGLYNTPVNDDYFHGRVYYGGVNSWISLNTKRTAGWHKLTSIVSDLSVSFLVDGVLDTSIPLTDANKLYAFDGVIMGSGLTSGGYDVAFDDLSVSKAPEPVTVVLFGLGALLLRSRRTLSC